MYNATLYAYKISNLGKYWCFFVAITMNVNHRLKVVSRYSISKTKTTCMHGDIFADLIYL